MNKCHLEIRVRGQATRAVTFWNSLPKWVIMGTQLAGGPWSVYELCSMWWGCLWHKRTQFCVPKSHLQIHEIFFRLPGTQKKIMLVIVQRFSPLCTSCFNTYNQAGKLYFFLRIRVLEFYFINACGLLGGDCMETATENQLICKSKFCFQTLFAYIETRPTH